LAKIAEQVGPSGPVHCVESALHQTVVFLIVYGKLHHGEHLVFIPMNAGLQFGCVECIHGACYLPD
jgi:hypothetical protein